LDIEYDIISGVSAGSINAAQLSLFGRGEEAKGANFAWQNWDTFT